MHVVVAGDIEKLIKSPLNKCGCRKKITDGHQLGDGSGGFLLGHFLGEG